MGPLLQISQRCAMHSTSRTNRARQYSTGTNPSAFVVLQWPLFLMAWESFSEIDIECGSARRLVDGCVLQFRVQGVRGHRSPRERQRDHDSGVGKAVPRTN